MRLKFVPALVCLLFPSLAAAQYADSSPSTDANLQGLELSLGLGYGTPFGDIYKSGSDSVALSDVISGQIPLGVGLGYRVNPLFSFGLAFEYVPLITKNCDAGSSCSAHDIHLGIEGRLHFATDQSFSPWISGGLGYEWISLSESGSQTGDMSASGLEFNFQVGGDYRVNSAFTLGPFIGLHVGNYDSLSASAQGQSGSADIPSANQTTHGWMTFGLRGAFTL
jgi:opacity protein-like surface antigen